MHRFSWVILIIAALVCGFDSVAPYALNQSMDHSVIFGEGIISTGEFELNAAFAPDGRSVYFTRTADFTWTKNSIYVSYFKDSSWKEPIIAEFSGVYADVDPFVTRDGRRIYFLSRRPWSGKTTNDYDIWYVEKTETGWSEARNIGAPVNSSGNEYYVSLTDNGNLYFSRDDGEIYCAPLKNGTYQKPYNLGKNINTMLEEYDPYITPDERFLFFSRAPLGGAANILVSSKQGESWSTAKPLNHLVNTFSHEFAPSVSPDGRYLFFTRMNSYLDGDIYQVELSRLELQ